MHEANMKLCYVDLFDYSVPEMHLQLAIIGLGESLQKICGEV